MPKKPQQGFEENKLVERYTLCPKKIVPFFIFFS